MESQNVATPESQSWKPKYNPYIIALAVTLATFMEILDTTIVNVSLPHIAGNLSATIDEVTWVLTSYLVSNAIVLPIGGWLTMLFGRKNFYQTCVVLFAISSLLCGLAPSLSWLIFFRVMQGLGGGGLAPSEQAILADTFPRGKAGMGMAVYGIAIVCAPIIGPTLGGWITDNYSWRWIFFINIPVSIVSIILTTWLVEDPPFLTRRSLKDGLKIDYLGLGLVALGLGFLQVVLDRGDRDDWFSSNFILICSSFSLVAILSAIYWELKEKDPVVDLRLFKERNFAYANLIMFMVGFVLFGSTLLIPIFLQQLLGYSAMMSGMVLSPGGFATMLLMPVVGILVSKVEARWLILIGIAVASLSLFKMSHLTLDVDYRTLVILRIYQACGLAFLFVPINAVAFYFIPKNKSSNASSLINLSRNLGASVGIAAAIHILSNRVQFHQSVLTSHLVASNPQYQTWLRATTAQFMKHGFSLHDATLRAQGLMMAIVMRHANMLSFADAFWLLGIAFLLMIPAIFLMRKASPQAGDMAMH